MDEIIAALDKLRTQRQQKHDELTRLDAAISNLELLLGQTPTVPVNATAVVGGALPSPSMGHSYEGLGITDAAVRYMREVGRAASTREIADQIRLRGVRTQSKNYTATVYAVLSSSHDKIVRTSDGLWDLKHRPPETRALDETPTVV